MESQITPLDPWINQKIGNSGRLTRIALEEYQLGKIQETLDLVQKSSPFYQKHLRGAPEKLSSLADLARLPFTSAKDIREQGMQFLCVSQDEIQRVVTLDTSGTTGQPKRVYFTADDQDLTVDFFNIGMSTFTAAGDRVLILLPCERVGSVGDLLADGLVRLGAIPIKHGIVRDYSETLAVIEKQKVNVLVGIPTQVLGLARKSPGLKLKSVLLSTDHAADSLTRAIEHCWQCRVYNHYGMTEMGLGGGVECQAHRGYHLREADLYFEVVNPETGQPVHEGEFGEVVFTTLTRKGMPLIRYRTGDSSRFLPGICPCGTSLRSLECIHSRIEEAVKIGEAGKLSINELDEVLISNDAVFDFDAILIHNFHQELLKLDVFALQAEDSLKNTLHHQLQGLPVIDSALREGSLTIQLEIHSGRDVLPLPGKRKILQKSYLE